MDELINILTNPVIRISLTDVINASFGQFLAETETTAETNTFGQKLPKPALLVENGQNQKRNQILGRTLKLFDKPFYLEYHKYCFICSFPHKRPEGYPDDNASQLG